MTDSIIIPTKEQLAILDQQLAAAGVAILDRPEKAAKIFYKSQGRYEIEALHAEPWFNKKYKALHPSVDFSPRPFMIMCGSALGISYFLKPPLIIGETYLDLSKYIYIEDREIKRIYDQDAAAYDELCFQAADGVDLWHSKLNFNSLSAESQQQRNIGLSLLAAYARQLIACEIDASLPQGMALACELVGKSIAVYLSDGQINVKQEFGHDLSKLAKYIIEKAPSQFDEAFDDTAKKLPQYVASRYASSSQSILQSQNTYRSALFFCAEAMRRGIGEGIAWEVFDEAHVP